MAVRGVVVNIWMLVASVTAHSSLVSPFARNSIDRLLPPWQNGAFGHNESCAHPSYESEANNATRRRFGKCWGCNCVNGSQPCNVGQTCTWFSQGCSIGCKTCDGEESNPNTRDRCNSGMKPTNNDPYFRTYNRDVPAMSMRDIYQHNPWRAPGNAPVYDACGMAGGSPSWVDTQLSFIDTEFAKQGDLGSKTLPRAPTGVVWTAGAQVEAKWSLRANHGGGYAYRLCPLEENLTEECFQQYHLSFAGKTFLEFGNGTRLEIKSRFLSNGTHPPGSMWAMNPLPFAQNGSAPQFTPPCTGADDWHNNTRYGLCAGRFPIDVTIVDVIQLPANLTPGAYVLGFRYDCEATAQVWSSCADIEVTSP